MRGDVQVPHLRVLVRERGQLVEVRGEHGGAPDLLDDVLADGPGQPEAVVRRGAAAQLVDDDQRILCGTLDDRQSVRHISGRGDSTHPQYASGLEHLCHERRYAAQLRVTRTNTA